MRRIGISITTYNRFQQTIDCFAKIVDNDRVAEIVIQDDASTDGSFKVLYDTFLFEMKVAVFQNKKNLDCYANKAEAIRGVWKADFAGLWDSDNVFDQKYIDALYAIPEWDEKTIYQPSFARPHFDFRRWSGLTITKENVAQYADTDLMTALNACNFFVNREEYLKVWDGSINPGSSDSIYFCYCWLNAGNKIHITPNLEYDHYIDPNNKGHYQTNSHKYVEFHNELMRKIKAMR